MWIHLHSLYAGILFLAIVAVFRFPLPVGLFCVPFCLAVDFGQFISRLQKGRQPWQFAFGSLLQSLVLYGVFALASVVVGGSFHAAMDSVAPRGALDDVAGQIAGPHGVVSNVRLLNPGYRAGWRSYAAWGLESTGVTIGVGGAAYGVGTYGYEWLFGEQP